MNPNQSGRPTPEDDNVTHVDFETGKVLEAPVDQQPASDQAEDVKARHPAFGNSEHIAGVMPADVQARHPRPDQAPQE